MENINNKMESMTSRWFFLRWFQHKEIRKYVAILINQ